MKFPTPLPIDASLPQILDQIRRAPITLIQSPPGTGKTVHLPIAALELGPVWVLEPRRVAARLAAGFAASEVEHPETVGYQFRNENRTTHQTRLTYLTEGMLLRRAGSDPLLRSVTTVILDEFHERHQQTDLAWAYLRHLQTTTRPDLKLVLLSATLDAHKLKSQVPELQPVQLTVPAHSLTVSYHPEFSLPHAVRHAENWLKARNISGSILVFLPGSREIDAARRELEPQVSLPIFSLYGSLPFSEQERITRPQSQAAARIILSTNLTESSVTIDGVRVVIDTGTYRQAHASPWSGIPKLTTRSITQASAIQRAGRAARQGPGLALRLYTEAQYKQFLPFETPELLRSDLSPALLTLAGLGVSDAIGLPWLDPPPLQTWQLAHQELVSLGFLSPSLARTQTLTSDGRIAQGLPATPRIARMVLDAARCPNPQQREALLRLAAQIATDALPAQELDPHRDQTVHLATRSEKQRLQAEADSLQKQLPQDRSIDLISSTLHAWSDRVAQRQGAPGQSALWLAASGQELYLPTTQHTSSPWMIALDVLESQRGGAVGVGGGKPLIRSWIAIQEEDLLLAPEDLWQEQNTLEWDPDRQSFWRYSRSRFGQITLSQKKRSPEASETLGQALFERWLKLAQAHPESLAELESCIERLKLSRILRPDCKELQAQWLGFNQITSLRDAPDLLSKDQDLALSVALHLEPTTGARSLEKAAPRSLQLPKRRAKILYRPGQIPEVQSRLQDFLGMRETPRVGQPAQPLKLILLAPNYRPVQVTQDLASFWKNTYPALRRELMRRYPRHAWPENPLEVLHE